MDFNPIVALVSIHNQVDLRITFPLCVCGGARRRDDCGTNGHELPLRLAHCSEVGDKSLKYLLAQIELLQ